MPRSYHPQKGAADRTQHPHGTHRPASTKPPVRLASRLRPPHRGQRPRAAPHDFAQAPALQEPAPALKTGPSVGLPAPPEDDPSSQAPVAQLDRASVYGTESRKFESFRARKTKPSAFGRGFRAFELRRGRSWDARGPSARERQPELPPPSDAGGPKLGAAPEHPPSSTGSLDGAQGNEALQRSPARPPLGNRGLSPAREAR